MGKRIPDLIPHGWVRPSHIPSIHSVHDVAGELMEWMIALVVAASEPVLLIAVMAYAIYLAASGG